MRGYFGVGLEQSSKPMNAGNLVRTAHAFGASFLFTVNAEYSVRKANQTRPPLLAAYHGMISNVLKN